MKVALPALSSDVVTSLMLSEGPGSSSEIVMVICCVPLSVAEPPETVFTSMIAVSSPSNVLSSMGVKLVVPVVSPAEIVMSDKAV